MTLRIQATQTPAHDADLVRDILALNRGEHLCLIYDEDPAEQLPALLPFMRQGLESDERCIYIADDLTVSQLEAALSDYGIDVADQTAKGALSLWTRAEWRHPGEVSTILKTEQVRRIVADALAAGFAGVRFAVEMTWTLGTEVDVDKLRHWEATVNTIFPPDAPVRIICQYSRSRLHPAVIQAGLLTHPVAVYGTEVCPNPFYEGPLIIGDAPYTHVEADPVRIEWMVNQLRAARAYEKEREQRLKAEAALDEAERSRKHIEELYLQAEAVAIELRKAVAVKDEFVGLVSHELRTPITVILGNAQVLLKTMAFDTDDHHEALLDIRAEAERLNRIIANLLILVKLEGGHIPEIEPILLVPTLERVLDEHRRRFPERRINVRYLSAGNPCLGNEVYVEQILSNLISNAQKYSPENAPIEVHLDREDEWRTIRVLDRGIGMGDGEIDQVFDAFYRTDAASRMTAGIGIGLTVCRRLVEAQAGRIWAKAREDVGSEFGFALRLCETPRD